MKAIKPSKYPILHKLQRLEDMSHHQLCTALVSAELNKITFSLIHHGESHSARIAQENLEEWLIKNSSEKT